jgi:magnesium transporter
MLTAYVARGDKLARAEIAHGEPLPAETIWVDVLRPEGGEDARVETLIGAAVPTREEMQEIEASSRLYAENGARYMTATVLYGFDRDLPRLTPVTFILRGKTLVTVRYEEPKPFEMFAARVVREGHDGACTADAVFAELLEAIVDRLADVLERVSAEIDILSGNIFAHYPGGRAPQQRRYQEVMRRLGQKGDLLSKARESLSTLGRLVQFCGTERVGTGIAAETREDLRSIGGDVQSLSDHANFLMNKVIFLVDSTVGLVSIQQNEIIKIFSVVAVIFLPPTLVASIYGMNYEYIPELQWKYGYLFALGLMLLSAILPYAFFKWKRWF